MGFGIGLIASRAASSGPQIILQTAFRTCVRDIILGLPAPLRDGNWFIQNFTWDRAIPRTCFSKRTPMPFPWNRRPWHRKAWTLGSHIWNWLDAVETNSRCDAR